jgi:hypothetical protein
LTIEGGQFKGKKLLTCYLGRANVITTKRHRKKLDTKVVEMETIKQMVYVVVHSGAQCLKMQNQEMKVTSNRRCFETQLK